MIISLLGYMGSGKSHIAKVLGGKLNYKVIDLDQYIALQNNMTIPEIFSKKGEIYFRKQEKGCLEEILSVAENAVVSLGGGTPAFYDNMKTINGASESVYLRATVATITSRLIPQKQKRPLIARISDDDLPEFIAKHLFERQVFYSQAKYTVSTDRKNPEEVSDKIILALQNQ